MSNVVDLWDWKRERVNGKPRPRPSRREGGFGSFVRIGDVSSAVVRRLRE